MRLLTVNGHWQVRPDHRVRGGRGIEAGVVLETWWQWLRLFAVYGESPGSHMTGKHLTVWRTDCGPGEVHGWNARAGWWPQPCVTLLVHTRPVRERSR